MHVSTVEYPVAGKGYPGVIFSNSGPSDATSRPGVLVLHGGSGSGVHEHERARRLAAEGYVAFAPDLFGERFTSRAHGIAVIQGLVANPAVLRERVAAALAFLCEQPGVDGARTAAIGFCFGGLAALELARSGADVRAVVSFHGGLTTTSPAVHGAIRCDVLVCTGSADPFVTAEHRAAFEHEMTNAGARWEMTVYGGALHGFTESGTERPGSGYHADADRRSWHAMSALFGEAMR